MFHLLNGSGTNYTLREDIVDTQRLFFDSYADTSITRLLEFNSPNKTVCDTVTVYILVCNIRLSELLEYYHFNEKLIISICIL